MEKSSASTAGIGESANSANEPDQEILSIRKRGEQAKDRLKLRARWLFAAVGVLLLLEAEREGQRFAQGPVESVLYFIGYGIGGFFLLGLIAVPGYLIFAAMQRSVSRQTSDAVRAVQLEAERSRGIRWEHKVFHTGDQVLINRDDPDYYENPMVIRPEDSPHSVEIDCDNGKTGVVTGGNNFGSLAVRWDAQEWREHKTRRRILLPSFESSIHPEHMDLASSITLVNPLKVQKRKTPGGDRAIDLSNKDWLHDLAMNTPMRDFVELPHEVLTNDYFIGLLDNAAVSAIGSAHHQLPRTVVQKIATQLLRRAEQDQSLAHFLELSKTAEPPWTFDWQKAAAG